MVAVITGASRGIGRALALRCAAEGTKVGLLARSAEGLEETLAAVRAAGGDGKACAADVTDAAALADAVAEFEDELGPVDVLVNNAGLGGPTGELWEVEATAWRRTFEVNLHGTFHCTRAVLPRMAARGRGRIVNVVSNAGAHRWPYFSAYAVSKAAVIKLTENLAAETRSYGVAVIAAHPGLVRAGLSENVLSEGAEPPDDPVGSRAHEWFQRQLAAGRTVSADEAAEFLAVLASGRADALSGRYVAIEDDLDAVLAQVQDVREHNLHALKVERLPEASAQRS